MADAELARASSGDKHTYNQVARELGLPVEPGEEEKPTEHQPDLALIDEQEEYERRVPGQPVNLEMLAQEQRDTP